MARYKQLNATRTARREAALKAEAAVRDQLLALLDKRLAELTSDGMFLRAELLADLAEDRLDARLGTWEANGAEGVAPKADYRESIAAVDKLLAAFPDTAYRASALYLQAYARDRSATTPDEERVAASTFLKIAYEFPNSPITVSAYSRAGDYYFGNDDHESLANAAQAFTWLADEKQPASASLHAAALQKLARTYVRLTEREKALGAFCPDPRRATVTRWSSSIRPAGIAAILDADRFRTACARGTQCPCIEPVATELAEDYSDDDDDDAARSVLELAAEKFPLGIAAPRTACSLIQIHERDHDAGAVVMREDMRHRFAPGEAWARHNIGALRDRDPMSLTACAPGAHPITAKSDVERAKLEVRASAGVRHCFNQAASPWTPG